MQKISKIPTLKFDEVHVLAFAQVQKASHPRRFTRRIAVRLIQASSDKNNQSDSNRSKSRLSTKLRYLTDMSQSNRVVTSLPDKAKPMEETEIANGLIFLQPFAFIRVLSDFRPIEY